VPRTKVESLVGGQASSSCSKARHKPGRSVSHPKHKNYSILQQELVVRGKSSALRANKETDVGIIMIGLMQ